MRHEIKFKNYIKIGFDSGKFDNWQVNIIDEGGVKYAPLDKDYFDELQLLGGLFGFEKVYSDFVSVYERTSKVVSEDVLAFINEVSSDYLDKALEAEILFTTLYYTMIAEENKAYTRLGKKIKRLGVHQVLVEKMPVSIAINYSKGKNWRLIDSDCEARGF